MFNGFIRKLPIRITGYSLSWLCLVVVLMGVILSELGTAATPIKAKTATVLSVNAPAGTVKTAPPVPHKRIVHVRRLVETTPTVSYVDQPQREIKKTVVADNYAAVVNGQTISMKEYKDALKTALGQLNRQEELGEYTVQAKDMGEDPQKSVLYELINMRIVREQATSMAISVPTAHVLQKINEIKKTFPSEEIFKNAITQEGIPYGKLAEGIRDQLLVDMLSERLAREYDVSDEQIWTFYNKNKDLFIRPEMIRVSKISFHTQPEAAAALKRIRESESFDDVQKKSVKEPDDDPATWEDNIERGQLSPKDERALFKLEVEAISQIVQLNEAFVICKVLDKRSKEYMDVKEAKEKIKTFLRVENQQAIYEEWLIKTRGKADIKINPSLQSEWDAAKQPTGNSQEPSQEKKKNKNKLEEGGASVS